MGRRHRRRAQGGRSRAIVSTILRLADGPGRSAGGSKSTPTTRSARRKASSPTRTAPRRPCRYPGPLHRRRSGTPHVATYQAACGSGGAGVDGSMARSRRWSIEPASDHDVRC
jgi:hypothetical protein